MKNPTIGIDTPLFQSRLPTICPQKFTLQLARELLDSTHGNHRLHRRRDGMWRVWSKSINNSLLMAGQCCHSNMKTETRACFFRTGGLNVTHTWVLFGFHFLILQFTGLYRTCQKDIHYRISKPHSKTCK